MKRGTKYPELVMNNSKACTSLTFCSSDSGELLPPYVVYKAQNAHKNWIGDGLEGVFYSCTQSEWFDSETFENWFGHTFILVAKHNKVSVLIGYNLSSHFSPEIFRLCTKYNITFICLPPNSTNNTQLLDIAFLHSIKVIWRKFSTSGKRHIKGGDSTKIHISKSLAEIN